MSLMKKYDIDPRIRDIIEKKLNKNKSDISNVELENIIENSFKGKYPNIKEYSNISKDRLFNYITDIDINEYKKDELLNFYNYIKNIFDYEQLDNIIKYYISKYYKPGYVFSGLKTYHENINYLMSLFNIYTYNGVIINTKFIGDMINIFPDVNFDENGIVTDDTSKMISDYVKNIQNDIPNIKVSKMDNLVVFAIDNDNTDILNKTFKGLKIDIIPVYYFKWE